MDDRITSGENELSGDDRRFTDQEVALVLRRAAELEEKKGQSAATRGLTLAELQDIAKEVGFSSDIVSQALSDLSRGNSIKTWQLLGPGPSAKSAVAAQGALTREQLQEFVRIMEDTADVPGTVTEALGTIRWTSVSAGNRFGPTTQVSITPAGNETHVQVLNRYPAKLRAVLQLIPTSWGLLIGGGLMASASGVGGVAAAATAIGAGLLGGLIGRGVWNYIAGNNEKDTKELAQDLAAVATEISTRATPGTKERTGGADH